MTYVNPGPLWIDPRYMPTPCHCHHCPCVQVTTHTGTTITLTRETSKD